MDPDALREILIAWIFGGIVVRTLKLGASSTDAVDDAATRLLDGVWHVLDAAGASTG